MPSQIHESHVVLFRNQPSLAAELIRDALGVPIRPYREARIFSSDLTEVQPAQHRAVLVVHVYDAEPVQAIKGEVQLQAQEGKRFVWRAYVANQHAKLECPVCLLVVTTDDAVARWAAKPVDMGGLYPFAPYVLGPSGIPEILDLQDARARPELAVLSAIAHGTDPDTGRAVRIELAAQLACVGLDSDRSQLYFDLIENSLSEAAREALSNMDLRKYEYQSEFARKYFTEGIAKGISQGRASLIIQLLSLR